MEGGLAIGVALYNLRRGEISNVFSGIYNGLASISHDFYGYYFFFILHRINESTPHESKFSKEIVELIFRLQFNVSCFARHQMRSKLY